MAEAAAPDRAFKGRGVGAPGSPYTGRAALRDASWFNSPGHAGRYHVVAADGGSECCGMPLILEDVGRSARDMTSDPAAVDAELRCQRNGCRQKWEPEGKDDGPPS